MVKGDSKLKLNICQEIKCKNLESEKHVGTLCKKHYEKREKHLNNIGFDPLEYKTLNQKNCVWENGCEHVRSIKASMINNWIARDHNRKNMLQAMLKEINDQIELLDEKILDNQKIRNSRYHK